MKSRHILSLITTLFVLAACETAPRTADTAVRVGMSRDDLRYHFGEPLRIEATASGGEDWYYRFASWEAYPTGAAGTTEDYPGETISHVSVGLTFAKNTEERPIHLSNEGYVIEPLPAGKVIKQEARP